MNMISTYHVRRIMLTLILALLLPLPAAAGDKDPVRGELLQRFMDLQQVKLQQYLAKTLPESEGYFVTGPLDIGFAPESELARVYGSVRVICKTWSAIDSAVARIEADGRLQPVTKTRFMEKARTDYPVGYRGVLLEGHWQGERIRIAFNTIQQTRWLIWSRIMWDTTSTHANTDAREKYLVAISDYFWQIDLGETDVSEPKADDYGLAEVFDLYAPPPPYVIEGYQNYLDYLHSYREIKTDFARGITAFVAVDSLLEAIKTSAPREAFPNKEAPMLQVEYRKFFDRSGDIGVIQTLTAVGFDTLKAGEYFFVVGLDRSIRFGRELTRLEVNRLEETSGRKVPRANHSFLFPGEPIFTAGAFFIERDDKPRLVHVNAQSGHYFYSNVTATIREDIAIKSDYYLLTLGHFFRALDDLGIEYESVLISKM